MTQVTALFFEGKQLGLHLLPFFCGEANGSPFNTLFLKGKQIGPDLLPFLCRSYKSKPIYYHFKKREANRLLFDEIAKK